MAQARGLNTADLRAGLVSFGARLKAAQPRLLSDKLATAVANTLARIAWSVPRHNLAFDGYRVERSY